MVASHEVSDCERIDIAVLVVDDDTTTLSVNAGFLRSWEYKVATATSGHEALETLREFRGFFDLVITDLNMRGMNGFELQKHVKSEFHLPVIIISADRRKSVMSKSLEQGAAFCLVKPVRREDLRDVWQYAVAGRREKLRVENGRIVSVRDEEEGEGDSASSPGGINNIASTQNSTSPNKKQRKKFGKRNRSEVAENEGLVFSGPKRSKICWTVELNSRFLLALRHLGMDKAVPTKILEIMNVPGLTRENVASHLQKYHLFLKRIAEKGILEGLPERALRSRFAMGLPADLIRDIQKRVRHFHLHETYYHQPYSSSLEPRPQIPQTRLVPPPSHYGGTNHITYGNFHQPYYHHLHRPLVNGGGFMTSANALITANNGLMSNYPHPSLVGNNRSFNYGPSNYDNNNNNNHGMMVPYGSSGLQRNPRTYNNHHRTQLNNDNNNYGMIVSSGSSGLQRSPSTYNNHHGTQLNNNASLTVGALNRVQNVGYTGHNSNGSASNNAIVPVSSSSVEPTRPNISAGLPSLPQQSTNGIRNAVTVNQREVGQMDDLNELFLTLDDMVSLDKTAESPRTGERSNSDILSFFNIEDYIELLQGDGAQTSERSINVVPNKSSSSCTNESPNMVMRNEEASTNLEPLNMFMTDKVNSPSGNTTPDQEQDWDMDLIETLIFDAADPSQK